MISCILLPFSKKSTLRPFNIISECPMLYLFYPLYKICENFIYIPPRKSYSFSLFFPNSSFIFLKREISSCALCQLYCQGDIQLSQFAHDSLDVLRLERWYGLRTQVSCEFWKDIYFSYITTSKWKIKGRKPLYSLCNKGSYVVAFVIPLQLLPSTVIRKYLFKRN